ncbi:ParB/RepB/Spo0J family partition protein [Deinococcus sp.]|uniref:ParB/RepB/Spo0J family partition protein n=1 Tax=Deinococcus sp. TaxID=47478 RepID=UPI003B5BE100
MTLGGSAVSRLIAGQGERPPATMVPLENIEVLPGHNPRGQITGGQYDPFSETALQTLTSSIREKGLLQPILIVKHPEVRDRFLLVAGERRWQAYRLLKASGDEKFSKIPAVIHPGAFDDALELAIIENGQREDPDLVDETWAVFAVLAQLTARPRNEVPAYLRQLRNSTTPDEFGVEEKLRALLGNRAASLSTWAQRRSRILLLQPAEIDAVSAKRLPITTALHLTQLDGPDLADARDKLLSEAIKKNLPASEVEQRVKRLFRPAEAVPSTLSQLRQALPQLARLEGASARKADKLMQQLLALLPTESVESR